MSDGVNKVEIEGIVKWEPRVFEPQEEGHKTITVFAIEWVRPKSDNKRSVFHVKTFGKLAEKLKAEKISQGDTVLLKGSINESKWKDKQTDEWRNQIEIWPLSVEFKERVEGTPEDEEDTSTFTPSGNDEEDADDIPF